MRKGKEITALCALLAVLLTAASCRRRPLYDEWKELADLTVHVDWSRTPLRPEGVTVLFYPIDGGAPTKAVSNTDTVRISVPQGRYCVLVFNETFGDFDNLRFGSVNGFEAIHAYTDAETASSYECRACADPLAAWSGEFEVTWRLVEYSAYARSGTGSYEDYERHLSLYTEPVLITTEVNVTATVRGLDMVTSTGGFLGNMADSLFLARAVPAGTGAIHKVTFDDVSFTSETEGVVRESFVILGHVPETFGGDWFDFRATLDDGRFFRRRDNLEGAASGRTGEWGQKIIDIVLGPYDMGKAEKNPGWDVDLGKWDSIDVPSELF